MAVTEARSRWVGLGAGEPPGLPDAGARRRERDQHAPAALADYPAAPGGRVPRRGRRCPHRRLQRSAGRGSTPLRSRRRGPTDGRRPAWPRTADATAPTSVTPPALRTAHVLDRRTRHQPIDHRGPVEPGLHRHPPRHRGRLQSAGLLYPPHVPLDLHSADLDRGERVRVLVGAPGQEGPQVRGGMGTGLPTVAAQEPAVATAIRSPRRSLPGDGDALAEGSLPVPGGSALPESVAGDCLRCFARPTRRPQDPTSWSWHRLWAPDWPMTPQPWK